MKTEQLPLHLYSGKYGRCHVQGIATDGEFFYLSFTTMLLKTDLAGNAVGSVTGLTGHLGCIALAPDGSVIGSLEYKNDEIGQGILKTIGQERRQDDAFYAVRFDPERIDRMNMDALTTGVMTRSRLTDVCEDYAALVEENGAAVPHRYGCSGIDGITCLPEADGTTSVLVAYGIYGDTNRQDNDCQVLVQYRWERLLAAMSAQTELRCDDRIFVRTGNTTYGIQNLEYDPYTDLLLAAVYPGRKPSFPNYELFWIDPKKRSRTPDGQTCFGLSDQTIIAKDGLTVDAFLEREPSGEITGCRFPLGSTGIIALGDGTYYFSEDDREGDGPDQCYTHIRRFRLTKSGFQCLTDTAN